MAETESQRDDRLKKHCENLLKAGSGATDGEKASAKARLGEIAERARGPQTPPPGDGRGPGYHGSFGDAFWSRFNTSPFADSPFAGNGGFRYTYTDPTGTSDRWEQYARDPKVKAAEDLKIKIRMQRQRVEQVPGWWENARLSELHKMETEWHWKVADEEFPALKARLEYKVMVREDEIPALIGQLAMMLERAHLPEQRKAIKEAMHQTINGMLATGYDDWIDKEMDRRTAAMNAKT